MSLFPAYTDCTSKDKSEEVATTSKDTASKWLENNSFPIKNVDFLKLHSKEDSTLISSDDEQKDSNSAQHSDNAVIISSTDEDNRKKTKKQKKKHKKSKKSKKIDIEDADVIITEFQGDEEFYVHNKPAIQYKTIDTLHKPACPRYYKHLKRKLGYSWYNDNLSKKLKRYPRYFSTKKCIDNNEHRPKISALAENDYTLRLGQLNRKVMETPQELQHWLNLIQLQDRNPYKWSRLLLAEKKLDILQRALSQHTRCEQLYSIFIRIINATYPSFEVSKMLDRLLHKDPNNYTLWHAQIMTTQGSMARCIVPDVLRIYERCMQKMHHAPQTSQSDEVMLRLFSNCALFLRQAGLSETFFGLVHLALELNISVEGFKGLKSLDSEQQELIEFEECILNSGLPMNEIWLRIEKLREAYNFLPCTIDMKCSDPQRIVYNEDVCHYIYPLKKSENSFYLMILILRLLKLPFINSDGLAKQLSSVAVEDIGGDSDAIEDMLVLCVRSTYALTPQQQINENKFLERVYELAKEMVVNPTFVASAIGSHLYTKCLHQMLMNCAANFAGVDERKRAVFLLLFCRFERMLLVSKKAASKTKCIEENDIKAGKSNFKTLLKQNRNAVNLFTEYALFEFEALKWQQEASDEVVKEDHYKPVRDIFENLIAAHSSDKTFASDISHMYVCYVEILIGLEENEEALRLLVTYALSLDIRNKVSVSSSRKLAATQKLAEKVEHVVNIERNVAIMVLEQYLLPDYTVSLIKLRTYILILLAQKKEALAELDKLLRIFLISGGDRHSFLREEIQMLYLTIIQMPCNNCYISNRLISNQHFQALEEFPRNLFLLQRCGMLNFVPWYKLRSNLLNKHPSIHSLTTLIIVLARYLHMESNPEEDNKLAILDFHHKESIVHNRVLNMFQNLTNVKYRPTNLEETINEEESAQPHKQHESGDMISLHRNALFWRLHLRFLSDMKTSFETSKRCLLTALDECPWSKALYLDGAKSVPQELPHLQDLMIEKQLRVYALPEELEILREEKT